ncbi:hypothetical protein KUCAC02_036229 [Chaenocephalus aceratus]|nr:hypothetical protein KUCAC02_036229 [Chaenocephalus aceratus]
MALAGVRVIELAGLAPAPFCGMILADFGAKVIRVDRTKTGMSLDTQARGKRSVAINLKTSEGVSLLKKLCLQSDVVLEPYRKGVMEKLGLGPQELLKEKPSSDLCSTDGIRTERVVFVPAGSQRRETVRSSESDCRLRRRGAQRALGIVLALLERERSGRGQVIDASMVSAHSHHDALGNGQATNRTCCW